MEQLQNQRYPNHSRSRVAPYRGRADASRHPDCARRRPTGESQGTQQQSHAQDNKGPAQPTQGLGTGKATRTSERATRDQT